METNNVAEYTAVLMAIEWLTHQSPTTNHFSPVVINLDSQLIERQLKGFIKLKTQN